MEKVCPGTSFVQYFCFCDDLDDAEGSELIKLADDVKLAQDINTSHSLKKFGCDSLKTNVGTMTWICAEGLQKKKANIWICGMSQADHESAMPLL